MKIFFLLCASILALTGSYALGATLDNFGGTTASDSVNYNTELSFGGPAEPFTITGGALQPTGTGGTTTTYLWKAGETFGVGDTVSIDILNVDGSSNLAGLAFTTGLTAADGTDNYVFLGLIGDVGSAGSPATGGDVDVNGVSGGFSNLNFGTGSVTESATRTATGFTFEFSGLGLTGAPITGNYTDAAYTGHTVYFGINIYGGDSPGGQRVNNLDYTVAPEPSTYALMLAGLAFLGFCARRKLA